MAFAGEAWQWFRLDLTEVRTIPGGVLAAALVGPSGQRLAEATIDGSTATLEAELPADGRYTIVLEPAAVATAGATLRLTEQLIETTLHILEAPGKPAKAEELAIDVYRAGDYTRAVARAELANTVTLRLRPGPYEIVPFYVVSFSEPYPVEPLLVSQGTRATRTISLNKGFVRIEVNDAQGMPTDPSRLVQYAYLAGRRDVFTGGEPSTSNATNWVAHADVAFDYVIVLDGDKEFVLPNQIVQAGEERRVRVSTSEFVGR